MPQKARGSTSEVPVTQDGTASATCLELEENEVGERSSLVFMDGRLFRA